MAPRPTPTQLPTRRSGQKEGVLVVWAYMTAGKRVLLAVRLGQREPHEDWLDLGRDLTRRGLRTPWFVVSDGAPVLMRLRHLYRAGYGETPAEDFGLELRYRAGEFAARR